MLILLRDFDVSPPSPTFNFASTDTFFLVFGKGEELVKALPLQCVSPRFVFGFSYHPVLCFPEIGQRDLFVLVIHGVPLV